MPETETPFRAASLLPRIKPNLVDKSGLEPICHVRLGSLLPSEKGRSDDTLANHSVGSWKDAIGFQDARRRACYAPGVRMQGRLAR